MTLHYIPALQALLQGLFLGLCGRPVPLLQPAWPPLPLAQPVVQLVPLLQPAVVLLLLLPLLGEQPLPLLRPAMQLVLLLQLDESPAVDTGMLAKCGGHISQLVQRSVASSAPH